MKAFLGSLILLIAISALSYMVIESMDHSAETAYSTTSVRH